MARHGRPGAHGRIYNDGESERSRIRVLAFAGDIMSRSRVAAKVKVDTHERSAKRAGYGTPSDRRALRLRAKPIRYGYTESAETRVTFTTF